MSNELTVESALKELREMFPNHYRRIEVTKVDSPVPYSLAMVMVYEQRDRPLNGIVCESALTLNEAMAQVRAWHQSQRQERSR